MLATGGSACEAIGMVKNWGVERISMLCTIASPEDLVLFEVAPGLRIAILNILGDVELTVAAAKGLAEKLNETDYDLFVTAEEKNKDRS